MVDFIYKNDSKTSMNYDDYFITMLKEIDNNFYETEKDVYTISNRNKGNMKSSQQKKNGTIK
jgi:methenyltetrahydromethanopterin cyclohydrolase